MINKVTKGRRMSTIRARKNIYNSLLSPSSVWVCIRYIRFLRLSIIQNSTVPAAHTAATLDWNMFLTSKETAVFCIVDRAYWKEGWIWWPKANKICVVCTSELWGSKAWFFFVLSVLRKTNYKYLHILATPTRVAISRLYSLKIVFFAKVGMRWEFCNCIIWFIWRWLVDRDSRAVSAGN